MDYFLDAKNRLWMLYKNAVEPIAMDVLEKTVANPQQAVRDYTQEFLYYFNKSAHFHFF